MDNTPYAQLGCPDLSKIDVSTEIQGIIAMTKNE